MANSSAITATCQAFQDSLIPIDLGPGGGGEFLVNLSEDGSRGMCYDIGPEEGGILLPDHPRYLNVCRSILEATSLVQEALWGDALLWSPSAVRDASAYLRRHGLTAVACGPKNPSSCGQGHLAWHQGHVGMALAGRIVDDENDLRSSLDHEIGHGRDTARLVKQWPRLATVIKGEVATLPEVADMIIALQKLFASRLPKNEQAQFLEAGRALFFNDHPVTDETGLRPERVVKVAALYLEILRFGEEIHDPHIGASWPERERALFHKQPGDMNESERQAIQLDRELAMAKYAQAGIWTDFLRRYQKEIDLDLMDGLHQPHVIYFQTAIAAASAVQASWRRQGVGNRKKSGSQP